MFYLPLGRLVYKRNKVIFNLLPPVIFKIHNTILAFRGDGTKVLTSILHTVLKKIMGTVFSRSDRKQNARSLLTPVSDLEFYALSCGAFGFALHGSFLNHFLIG